MKSPSRADGAPGARVRLSWIASLIVAALGARVLLLAFRYLYGSGTQRFHVESAATLFVLAGLTLRMVRAKRGDSLCQAPSAQLALWTVACWWGIALMLYWPALGIGFLSDDFVLADRAVQWQIGPVTPELFRPIPLMIWALLLRAGGGPSAIHALNILLHGTNGFLAARVVEPYVQNRTLAILAGVVVIAFPLSPEAVVWASGVFDVMATCFTLTLVLLARACFDFPSGGRRTAFLACGVAALFSKETAAIAPLLVFLDLWALRRSGWRSVRLDTILLTMFMAAVVAFRLASASSTLRRPITQFVVQRWILGTFGSAALPWHVEVLGSITWLPMLNVMVFLAMILSFFVWGDTAHRTRISASNAAFMLIATLPAMMVIGVRPDLQGARYQYLSSVGWAGLLVALAYAEGRERHRAAQVAGITALVVLIVTYVPGLRLHLAPWRAAGETRRTIEEAARKDSDLIACGTVSITGLPDSVRGAYVFRNGALEAFAHDIGVQVSAASTAECSYVWDGSGFARR